MCERGGEAAVPDNWQGGGGTFGGTTRQWLVEKARATRVRGDGGGREACCAMRRVWFCRGATWCGAGQQIAHACINASEAPQQHALEYSYAWVSSFCMHAGKASAACEDAYRPPR